MKRFPTKSKEDSYSQKNLPFHKYISPLNGALEVCNMLKPIQVTTQVAMSSYICSIAGKKKRHFL